MVCKVTTDHARVFLTHMSVNGAKLGEKPVFFSNTSLTAAAMTSCEHVTIRVRAHENVFSANR